MLLRFPIKGYHRGFAAGDQPPQTSPDLKNVRPLAGGRYQGGQRPGLEKTFDQQIGGAPFPVVAIVEVATLKD